MDYTLVKRLAVGGMAELFLARAHADGRYAGTVVIKTLRADETDPERAAGILRNEGRLGAALRHPSIVRLLEAETEVERPHLVLEFIFGRDLGQLFDRCRARHQPIPAEHVRTIVADVLEALDYTYYGARLEGAPVRAVHLDVSPQNVIVGFDGRTRLVDFGLAEGAHREEMRDRGGLAGKVPYMAPEQLRGAEVDHRTDLFGAGVLSWELLTQQRLFARGDDAASAAAVLAGGAPWPRCLERPVPWDLGWWTWQALRRDPLLRPRRGARWAARLRRGRDPEEGRRALRSWMGALYREPLARRAQAASLIEDAGRRREVLDAGFELLPSETVTEDLLTPALGAPGPRATGFPVPFEREVG